MPASTSSFARIFEIRYLACAALHHKIGIIKILNCHGCWLDRITITALAAEDLPTLRQTVETALQRGEPKVTFNGQDLPATRDTLDALSNLIGVVKPTVSVPPSEAPPKEEEKPRKHVLVVSENFEQIDFTRELTAALTVSWYIGKPNTAPSYNVSFAKMKVSFVEMIQLMIFSVHGPRTEVVPRLSLPLRTPPTSRTRPNAELGLWRSANRTPNVAKVAGWMPLRAAETDGLFAFRFGRGRDVPVIVEIGEAALATWTWVRFWSRRNASSNRADILHEHRHAKWRT